MNPRRSPTESNPPALSLLAWCPSPRGHQLLAMLAYKGLGCSHRFDAAAGPWPTHGGPELCAAIELNGQLLIGLDDISWALERLAPQRPLLPQASAMRALCLALSDWVDDSIYPLTLHYQWIDAAGEALRQSEFPGSEDGREAMARRARVVRAALLARGWLGRSADEMASALQRQLHAIDAMLIGQHYLFGLAPTVCDFGLAAQLSALAIAPGSAELLAQRPALGNYLARCASLTAEGPVITQGHFGMPPAPARMPAGERRSTDPRCSLAGAC